MQLSVTERLLRSTDPRMSASGRFGRYKKEDPLVVRRADVTGSELDHLRKRRDLLREMTPEQAFSVIEFHQNLTLFEALALAKREGKIIVPNDVHDRILTETGARYNDSIWTGTLVIYEAPDKPFGENVTFDSISFVVPEQFRGKINCALVVEHPDFDLVSQGVNKIELTVADKTRISLLENFPGKEGWYNFDKKSKIPVGEIGQRADNSRSLFRCKDCYSGLLIRYDDCYGRQGVYAYCKASDRVGVALF